MDQFTISRLLAALVERVEVTVDVVSSGVVHTGRVAQVYVEDGTVRVETSEGLTIDAPVEAIESFEAGA